MALTCENWPNLTHASLATWHIRRSGDDHDVSEDRLAPYAHDRHRADDGVCACCCRCTMSGGGRVIRWSTVLAVLGVAAVAAVASYEHAFDLVRAHGESGLDGSHGPADSGWADLRQFDGGAGFGAPGGAGSGAGAVAAWPAVAPVGSY